MTLQDIHKRTQYKYLALQTTNGSRSFYERFGFQRVGAPHEKTTNRKPPKSRQGETPLQLSSKSISPKSQRATTPTKPSTILSNTPNQQQVQPSSKVQTIGKTTLCKQKVKSYPRDRLNYFCNRVVQKKKNTSSGGSGANTTLCCIIRNHTSILPLFPCFQRESYRENDKDGHDFNVNYWILPRIV
jgi:hypothetical protein